jgi:hypothetical protein
MHHEKKLQNEIGDRMLAVAVATTVGAYTTLLLLLLLCRSH